jgi:YD repeat-containing protein
LSTANTFSSTTFSPLFFVFIGFANEKGRDHMPRNRSTDRSIYTEVTSAEQPMDDSVSSINCPTEEAQTLLPASRREFLKHAVVAGVGLAAAVSLPTVGQAFEGEASTKQRSPFPEQTLLDLSGKLRRPVPPELYHSWKKELNHSNKLSPSRAALLHLWVGEYELAVNEALTKAAWHFRTAQKLAPARKKDAFYGWASYNGAVTIFNQKKYREAAEAFDTLLRGHKTPLIGFDRRAASRWLKHTGFCAAQSEALVARGVPRPAKLNNECGAASLAACLRALKLPSEKATVLAATRVTERGSNLQDLVDACPKLGAKGFAVLADSREALLALPKPLVAHIQGDHFCAVTSADVKDGVKYLCSSCGVWPGGEMHVSWDQWDAMTPGAYLCVQRPESQGGKVMAHLLNEQPKLVALASHKKQNQQPEGIQIASIASASGLDLTTTLQLSELYRKLSGLIIQYPQAQSAMCGLPPASPTKNPAAKSKKDGDPVDLFSGEESYSAIDLVVYNPNGPDVVWSRSYRTLRGFESGYQFCDHGTNWSQGYNVYILDLTPAPPPAGSIWLQGGGYASITGTSAPGNSQDWEITYNSTVIASSDSRNGWYVVTGDGSSIWIQSPYDAVIDSGYTIQVAYTDENNNQSAVSGEFAVAERDLTPTTGQKYLVYSDGTRVGFTNSAVPDSNNPSVRCITEPGSSLIVDLVWNIDSDDPYYEPENFFAPGDRPHYYYVITFPDQSKWTTSYGYNLWTLDAPAWYTATALRYMLYLVTDRWGNQIQLQYDTNSDWIFPFNSFPLLTSISSSQSSETLLTINRRWWNGSIASIVDCYGRKICYDLTSVYNGNVPDGWPQWTDELNLVSCVVPESVPDSSAPLRWQYGYTSVPNGHWTPFGEENIPLLSTISQPSAGVNGVNTLTLTYEDHTCFVATQTDASGTKRTYSQVDASGDPAPFSGYTKVTIEDALQNVVTSYIASHDIRGNQTEEKDAAGNPALRNTFGSTVNPFGPTSVQDAADRQCDFTYDQFGNVLTITTPRLIETVMEYDYTEFASGRIISIQEGTKPATTFEYNYPDIWPGYPQFGTYAEE